MLSHAVVNYKPSFNLFTIKPISIMPLLPFTNTPIFQRVADRVSGDTVLCQIATWESLKVGFVGNELRLELGFQVDYHGCVNGQPGDPLPIGKGVNSWHQTLYANNDCAVYLNPSWVATEAQPQDPRNGEILYYTCFTIEGIGWESRALDGTRTALVGGLAAAPEPVIRQGDAFSLSMEQPLALAQLIKHHLKAANEAPFLKFS